MKEPLGEGPQSRTAEVEVWLDVANALLQGLNHALSNRVSSLVAVSLVGDSPTLGAADLQHLSEETEKLGALLRLYRLLESHERAPAEPIRLADAIPDALDLLAYYPTTRHLKCIVAGEAGAPPVLLVPSALVHALVLLLKLAADHRSDTPGGAPDSNELHLSCFGTPDWVTMVLEGMAPVPEGRRLEEPALAAVRWLLRGADVTVTESWTPAGGVRLTMRIASLANVRRRERGG